MKLQNCEISNCPYCFVFAKLWINCLNIKSDVPVNTEIYTNDLLKGMLILYINRPR